MSPIETAIRVIVDLIVRGEYEAIESLTRGRRLSAAELRSAVSTYGRRLAVPPANWMSLIETVPIDDAKEDSFFAAVPLWTEEEGRSDLTLELRLSEFAPGIFNTEVLDLHVL